MVECFFLLVICDDANAEECDDECENGHGMLLCWLEKVVVGVFGNVNHGEPLLLKVY